jgi:tRNA pseudouridine38-40 synthase
MKFKLLIEYNGTNYSGWQKQKNARSIQGTLIRVIEDIFKRTKAKSRLIDLQGAGRTDSGVHAYGQVAHLEADTMLAPEILMMKINDELPSDINILDVTKVKDTFHARHSAKSRQYIYRISRRRTAFQKRYVWWIKDRLDVNKMRISASLFKGMHDFSSFSEKDNKESPKVLVEDIEITENDYIIEIRIKASHFLWKMVRRIVGTLAEVGRGNLDEKHIKNFLTSYSEVPAKYTAPPSGLFLDKIFY